MRRVACWLALVLGPWICTSCGDEADRAPVADPTTANASGGWRDGLTRRGWSKQEFAKLYAQAIRASIPGTTTVVRDDLGIDIAKGDRSITAFPDNAFAEASAEDADAVAVVESYVKALSTTFEESVLKAESLMLVVRPRAYLDSIHTPGKEYPKRELVQDLFVLVAEDTERMTRIHTVDQLEEAGFPLDKAFETAMRNLAALGARIRTHGDGPFTMLTIGGQLESSLLALAPLWKSLEDKVKGDIVAAVPARDVLLFTGSENVTGIAEMKDAVKRVTDGGDHLITTTLLVWRQGKWNLFDG